MRLHTGTNRPDEDSPVDVKTLMASAPMIRKAWRVVPGPLKIPLIVVAAIVWFVKRGNGDGDDTPTAGSDQQAA